MATTTRRVRKTTTSKAGTSKPKATKAKATPKADDGPSKRELLAEQNAANTERILELRDAEQSWAEIAEELSITSGKAQFLMMCHLVTEGEVPAITFRNDDELIKKAVAARSKADQYSSWGWISARTGVSEGRLKGLLEESGDFTPKSENIAAIRAEKNGTAPAKKGNAPAKGKPAVKAAAKTTAAAAKATAARKRAARTAGKGKAS